jgi:hypothetical protein
VPTRTLNLNEYTKNQFFLIINEINKLYSRFKWEGARMSNLRRRNPHPIAPARLCQKEITSGRGSQIFFIATLSNYF